ncbi:MAG: RidA family protein [Bacteroidetes bacterium]|nr:RidA family protein [Bacteroidota bacterium]MBK7969628.1 RidA family protein [Bacteroidota bacterium]MBK8416082.1 RidA family protein [Bacteroidota bacterium]MBK9045719.1 RidA family protein [Bacteroidota bacterium]MBK9425534.1 RidA family protein [Bacteroidota bacterium]
MKTIIKTFAAPAPIGPYSQAVLAGNFLFVSGQIAINPATGKMVQTSISDEAKQVMENLKAILEEAGLGFENVVKTSIFLMNIADFNAVNEVYGSFFSGDFPARETVQVAKLPKDANVEISIVAVKG